MRSLKKIVTFRPPVSWRMEKKETVLDERHWVEARKDLIELCQRDCIELDLVDLQK